MNETTLKDMRDFRDKTQAICMKELGFIPEYPEAYFVLRYMLNIDPSTVVAGSLTKKTYKVFKFKNGERIFHNNQSVKVTRKFTPEQQKIVRELWPLIPAGAKQ